MCNKCRAKSAAKPIPSPGNRVDNVTLTIDWDKTQANSQKHTRLVYSHLSNADLPAARLFFPDLWHRNSSLWRNCLALI